MTHADFSPCMDALRETYGDRAYPNPRVEKIWHWAKRLNPAVFKKIIDTAISDCERPPLIGKLKEIYAEIRKNDPSADKINCLYCDGSGWICDDQPLPTAFACQCEAGQQIPERIARWKGPWKRMVPFPSEIIRVNSKQVISAALNGEKHD